MLNHTYTLLLNTTTSSITEPLRITSPDFRAIAIPTAYAPLHSALYSDCRDVLARQERTEALLAVLTTPELLAYTLKFDPRNTYAVTPSTLLSMCTTDITAGFGDDQLDAISTGVRLCPSLFSLPDQAEDMDTLRRTYHTAPDRYLSAGAAVLAYVYQLENVRLK